MKSEKAKKAIERYRQTFSAPYQVAETAEYCRLFKEIAEIAEQEAEERMRKRAAKAYCDECCWAAGTACEREVAHCAFLRAFTKKLNGE